MKKTIVIGAMFLLPTAAGAWDTRDYYYENQRYEMDAQRNAHLGRIADEMQYQNDYREYETKMDQWNQYNPLVPCSLGNHRTYSTVYQQGSYRETIGNVRRTQTHIGTLTIKTTWIPKITNGRRTRHS